MIINIILKWSLKKESPKSGNFFLYMIMLCRALNVKRELGLQQKIERYIIGPLMCRTESVKCSLVNEYPIAQIKPNVHDLILNSFQLSFTHS